MTGTDQISKSTNISKAHFSQVEQAVRVFRDYERPWAVCGGWAIDLFLNRSTRSHKDVDFAVLRKDQLAIQEHLFAQGWILEKAFGGQLVPWKKAEWIDLPVHIIWCKHPKRSPDFIELLFNEVYEVKFLFRRDISITLPLEKMIIFSTLGIPILAPEIVLLYKSGNAENPSTAADFENILPRLSPEARDWFVTALKKLNPNHTWLKAVSTLMKGSS